MIKRRLSKLKDKLYENGLDGYVIPKNDEFFSEYSQKDRLKTISNFTGSAGLAIILKNKNYLFVDGRYTIQAEIETGKVFKIINFNNIIDCKLFKNLTLGLDPKLFTSDQIKRYFLKYNKVKEIKINLIDLIFNKYKLQFKPFFSLNTNIVGESHLVKIKKTSNFIKKKKSNYLFISAPENVAWLLNIRGYDNPNSPIPNCRLLISDKEEIFFISDKDKAINLIKEKKIKEKNLISPNNFHLFISNLKKNKIIIDTQSCSSFYEKMLRKKFKILKMQDPIYFMKSIKNFRKLINNFRI